MKIAKKIWLPIAFLSFSQPSYANNTINVLVVETLQSSLTGGDSVHDLAVRFEDAMDLALENSGMGGREVKFYSYIGFSTYVGDALPGSTSQAALDHLKSGDDSVVTAAREGLFYYPLVDGFDVVMMLVDGIEVCGRATLLTEYGDSDNAEERAWVVVKNSNACVNNFANFVIPHEIGHVLGGEHQSSGGANADSNPDNPVDYNHPVYTTNAFTLLGSPTQSNYALANMHFQYSKFAAGNLPGTSVPVGSLEEDNRRLFSLTTFEEVADYRPKPPPTAKECPPVIMYCSGDTGVYAITPSINEPYHITEIEMFTRFTPQQSWVPRYEGGYTCPTYGSSRNFLVKFLIHTLYGTAECYDSVVFVDCQQGW